VALARLAHLQVALRLDPNLWAGEAIDRATASGSNWDAGALEATFKRKMSFSTWKTASSRLRLGKGSPVARDLLPSRERERAVRRWQFRDGR
jgi:hypothetical protein